MPFLEVHLQEWGLASEAGIADRDVDAAEFLDRRIDHRRDRLGLRDVGEEGQGAAAGGADLLGGLLDDGAVAAAVDDDRGAVAGERLGDRLADVLTRAGDDRDLASQRLVRHLCLHP